MNGTRKYYKTLLTLRQAATDVLVIIPDHLAVLVFFYLGTQSYVLGQELSGKIKPAMSSFEVVDSALLLLILMTMPLMMKMVDGQFKVYQTEASNLARPDLGDIDVKLASSKALMSMDMSLSRMRPLCILGILECDSSLPVKFFSALIPFVFFIVQDIAELREKLKSNS
ncbi:hypothetical protein HDE_11057 [Halotydeus destructor]|nr:hypothetical protein HDE_11057 [Halotydeus destructor]